MTNNTSALPSGASGIPLEESWRIVFIAVNAFLGVVTVSGNFLVISAFWVETSLRTKANYFIISLAIADLLVGALAQPLYSTFFVHFQWDPPDLRKVYEFSDVLFGVASILNLLGVSLVSAHAIARPLKHRAQRDTGYIISAFAFPWFGAIIPATASILVKPEEQKVFSLVISIIFYFIPLVLIIFSYIIILNVVRKRKFIIDPGHTMNTIKQDLKAAMTMLIVIGCFVVTWLPFFIVILLVFHCTSCNTEFLYNMKFIFSIKTFQYAGSCINPMIYAFRRTAFKRAFLKIYNKLCPFCKSRSDSVSNSLALPSTSGLRRGTMDTTFEIRH